VVPATQHRIDDPDDAQDRRMRAERKRKKRAGILNRLVGAALTGE
jgi:hypothetical protein